MKTPITVLTVGLGLLVIASRAHAIMMVRAGQAEAVIVIPAGSKAAGAADLQSYVEKVSGAKLEIVTEDKLGSAKSGARVFVGPCLAASRVVDIKGLQPEGFVIKTDGDDLFIVGRDATDTGLQVAGTFYGVCEFLERYLGVRWLREGPVGEVAPKRATIQIASADIRQEPVLCLRGNSSQRVAADQASRAGRWSAYQRLGSRVKISTGHAYGGWWDKYHEQYPDIFALQPNGTRINTHQEERLCESNPVLWKLVAQEKIKELRANPGLLAASISENDGGPNKFCSCATCRSWDSPETQERFKADPNLYLPQESDLISDRVYRFYNEVAKLLWDPHRDVDPIIDDYCRAAYGPGAEAMKEYYRRAEDLANRIAATGKPNRDLDVRIEKDRNKLTDPYTDAELAKLQACVDKAAAAIGSSDAAALERVRLVATGLEYTQKTRDLLAAAAAVRAGKSTREEFNKIKAETDKYYGSLGGSLAVRVSRDIQSCLSLTPDFK